MRVNITFDKIITLKSRHYLQAFLKNISVSNTSIKCEACTDGTPRPRTMAFGICYLMEFKSLKDPFLQSGYGFSYISQKYSNFAKKHGWIEGDTEDDDSKVALLYLGNTVSEYMPLDYVIMQNDESLRIRYSAALHRRLNTKENPCFTVEARIFSCNEYHMSRNMEKKVSFAVSFV